mmetsp:Transcript_11581/g.15118  ORF Transcript_11581/g.15118 Transcript_11581/m.15118 type:complete len:504 (-) Transcript_11581:372-1883(-)
MVKFFRIPKPCGATKNHYGRGAKRLLVKIVPKGADESDETEASPREIIFDVEAPCLVDSVKELLIKMLDPNILPDDIRLIFRGRILDSGEFLDQEVYRAAGVGEDSDLEEEECTYSVWVSIFTKEDEEELEAEMKGDKGPKSKIMAKRLRRQESKKTERQESDGSFSSADGKEPSQENFDSSLQESADIDTFNSKGLKKSAKTLAELALTSRIDFQSSMEVGTAIEAEAFDIMEELTNIGCGRWAPLFISQGYSQKGAFAHLSEEVLKKNPFFIHREARRKILLLADMMKRHQELLKSSGSLLDRVNSEASSGTKYTLDGVNFYNNLAELDHAWNNKQNEERKEQAKPPVLPPDKAMSRKHYSRHIREVMEKIIRRNTLDEYGVPLEVDIRMTRQGWCCPKHERIVNARVDQLVRQKVEAVMIDTELELWRGDEFNCGFIPPETLTRIASNAFHRCQLPESPAVLNNVVSPCFEEGEGLWVDQKMFRENLNIKLSEESKAKMI